MGDGAEIAIAGMQNDIFKNRRKPWHCRPAPMYGTAEAYYRSLCVQGDKVDITIARIDARNKCVIEGSHGIAALSPCTQNQLEVVPLRLTVL